MCAHRHCTHAHMSLCTLRYTQSHVTCTHTAAHPHTHPQMQVPQSWRVGSGGGTEAEPGLPEEAASVPLSPWVLDRGG